MRASKMSPSCGRCGHASQDDHRTPEINVALTSEPGREDSVNRPFRRPLIRGSLRQKGPFGLAFTRIRYRKETYSCPLALTFPWRLPAGIVIGHSEASR